MNEPDIFEQNGAFRLTEEQKQEIYKAYRTLNTIGVYVSLTELIRVVEGWRYDAMLVKYLRMLKDDGVE